MPQIIKQHDEIILNWPLNVSLTDTIAIRFLMNSSRRPNPPSVDKEATLDPEDDTVVVVSLTSDDTAVAGRFNVEFETVWSDGQIITFPAKGYERLIVVPDLGGVLEESESS